MKGTQTWYFTFGVGQPNAHHVQPIEAHDFEEARRAMFTLYGSEWCWQYSEDEWNKIKSDPNRYWPLEKELPLFVASEY